MLEAIIISTVYVLTLFGLTKLFGVKYTEILKNTDTVKRGIVLPIGIATALLVAFSIAAGYIPKVFSFEPKVTVALLWLIPLATVVSIIARFCVANKKAFNRKGWVLLIFGAFIVGLSEELLVRGIAVSVLLESGYSVLLAGIISSAIFGMLHIVNYFNGQDIKKTAIQVVGTTLMGLNFYVLYVISGTLWVPIFAHFLYDLSIFSMGHDPKLPDNAVTKTISVSTLAMFILPLFALFYI